MKIISQGRVVVGDNFHSSQNCFIITDKHNFNVEMIPYNNFYIVKNVKIEGNVWIGPGDIILGGVEIGEIVIVQASSVVLPDIPKFEITGGYPATVFKY